MICSAPEPVTPLRFSVPATSSSWVRLLGSWFAPLIVPVAADSIVVGVSSVPPSHVNAPVTEIAPPLTLVVHSAGFCVSVKLVSSTVGTASTCAKQSSLDGWVMITESPSPGTPTGLQLC